MVRKFNENFKFFSHEKFQNSVKTKSLVFHDNYLLKHCSYDFRAILINLSIVLVQVLDTIYHINRKMNDPTFLWIC